MASETTSRFIVREVDRDRYARTTETKLGNKLVNTEAFATLVRSGTEFDTYIDIVSTYHTKHLGLCVIPIILARSTTELKIQQLKELRVQKRLEGGLASQSLQNFFDNTIILIDPYTEYPYYEFQPVLDKMQSSIAIPDSLQELVTEFVNKKKKTTDRKELLAWKKRQYVNFWLDLKSNSSKRISFAQEFMNSESARGASAGIPSVPIITCDHAELFEVTKEMNRVCKATWKDRECLTSVVLEQDCISDSELMGKISDYINSEDCSCSVKIKNFDMIAQPDALERDRYRQFMEKLAEFRKKRSKLAILLEAGPQAFPSAVVGFDIVSTSMRGLDKDSLFGESKEEGWGGYLDPKWLNIRKFSEVRIMFENNGHKLPCTCEVCRQITDLKAITRDFWNIARRKHYVLTMDSFMSEICQHIKDRKIELAWERIINSELCPLKRLAPLAQA